MQTRMDYVGFASIAFGIPIPMISTENVKMKDIGYTETTRVLDNQVRYCTRRF